MSEVLHLAGRGMGRTSPNPLVGAVIAKDNLILGRGFHRKFGEAHAETIALFEAKSQAADATLYTNLEPCIHYGKTPPCVEAIIRSKIKKVVIAMLDPNPAVAGKGVAYLKKNNIDVGVGLMNQEALELNRAYVKFVKSGRPYIIVKIAASKDGKIASLDRSTADKYITSLSSRRMVHALRGYVDAVLVGINTILTDNPYLTNRYALGHNPSRIILDTQLRTPLKAYALEPDAQRIIVCDENTSQDKIDKYLALGIKIIRARTKNGKVLLNDLLTNLAQQSITSIMVEGGGEIFTSFLEQGLYDEIILYVAPNIIGEGKSFTDQLDKITKLENIKVLKLDEDLVYNYVHRNN